MTDSSNTLWSARRQETGKRKGRCSAAVGRRGTHPICRRTCLQRVRLARWGR
ncbi:hypothetical protein B0T16DRAFT_416326 [Cercophora newfieldiana]|uniref:Uncharacterized protein n=1 Tax=Cercophora newfieldiana TaxID=92897 RepID=A0AA40CNM0_9PEZI|nr:hypothetical protein B0T16DRAFT_416326 [Cercophora newfieldiana]